MAQLENIEAIEKRLWTAADTLRSNSNYASNEYFMPVMGLIFLRHAYSRYLAIKPQIEATLPTRGGVPRALTREDFIGKTAIFLRPQAQFDYLVSLTDSDDRARAIIDAMESIEEDWESLRGVLPKQEYQELDNRVLGQLLRTLNPEELKRASGDVFGRIYEYFLTEFADLKAHDNGEFFTPISLVQFIANVLEPSSGTVFDPACGSGGMFVQSARFVELRHENPVERLSFRGMEKNKATINLAKMNLAVHGLEGDIKQAITYYEDPQELCGKCDYVMANPPFNVDEVDADRIKNDPRLPFGLPGVNKAGKVSNGNYLWISYFYSYLNEKGRAGFVMSSQASSAGRDEAKVRQKLIETGHVDIMVAIRGNFFYTRTVPCELWFLNRYKSSDHRDKVLMLDARGVYRKVTRKIFDFSPEQLQNLLSIIWLYRGETCRFNDLVAGYLERAVLEAERCFRDGSQSGVIEGFYRAVDSLRDCILPFLESLDGEAGHIEALAEFVGAVEAFEGDVARFRHQAEILGALYRDGPASPTDAPRVRRAAQPSPNGEVCPAALHEGLAELAPVAEASRDLVKQADLLVQLGSRLVDLCEKELSARESELWIGSKVNRARRAVEVSRWDAVEQLKLVRYFDRQAAWLLERFPKSELRPVEGLVKLVDCAELEKNDWSLTPGRYVGVAPEPEDDDFDFDEAMRAIHMELQGLNEEAAELAAKIAANLEGLIA